MSFTRPVNVDKTDTFDVWRQKTNQLSQDVGDLADLNAPLAGATSVVDALNQVQGTVAGNERGVLVRAMIFT